jgi:uncharacterized integral membrane protein
LLPLLWLLEWTRIAWAAALVALVSGLLLGLLSLAKWRMPLHFDIGDRGATSSRWPGTASSAR